MTDLITVSELARKTGLTIPHICMLRKRGVLPPGVKDGKTVYLPRAESELAIMGRKQRGPNKPTPLKPLTMSDLI